MSVPPVYNQAGIQASVAEIQKATTPNEISVVLQRLLDRYSLRLSTTCATDPSFTCNDIASSDMVEYKQMARLFVEEWAKYPPEWTKATNLQTINLVKDYQYNYMGNKQARAAAPMNYLRTMIYDIGYANMELYMRHVIHHEYVHYFEESYFGDVYHKDPIWASYNTAGFSYGGGGGTCYEPGNSCVTGEHPAQGFVTGYSMSGMEEDKAELYGYLFETTEYKQLKTWMQTDPVLQKKYDHYTALIRKVVPGMDEAYFANIHSNAPVVTYPTENDAATSAFGATIPVADYTSTERALWIVMGAIAAYQLGISALVAVGIGIWLIVQRHAHRKTPTAK